MFKSTYEIVVKTTLVPENLYCNVSSLVLHWAVSQSVCQFVSEQANEIKFVSHWVCLFYD